MTTDNKMTDTMDAICIERERFDLNTWKDRAPLELLGHKLNVYAEQQQVYRRNIETLISVHKSFKDNVEVQVETEKKVLEFIKCLTTSDVCLPIKTTNSMTE